MGGSGRPPSPPGARRAPGDPGRSSSSRGDGGGRLTTSLLDVVVVGAGAAGLVAGGELARAGLAVRVIEARRRVGGRAWTDQATFGVPIDRGCAWPHAADHNP